MHFQLEIYMKLFKPKSEGSSLYRGESHFEQIYSNIQEWLPLISGSRFIIRLKQRLTIL